MKASEARDTELTHGDTEGLDVLGIGDEGTARVLESVASETAREILASVQRTGKTPVEISDGLGTSTQNVRYHLDKLETANLVEVTGFRYSEKGREMSVYATAESPPVVVIGSLENCEDARRGGGDDDSGKEDTDDYGGERVTQFDTEDESRDATRPSPGSG